MSPTVKNGATGINVVLALVVSAFLIGCPSKPGPEGNSKTSDGMGSNEIGRSDSANVENTPVDSEEKPIPYLIDALRDAEITMANTTLIPVAPFFTIGGIGLTPG